MPKLQRHPAIPAHQRAAEGLPHDSDMVVKIIATKLGSPQTFISTYGGFAFYRWQRFRQLQQNTFFCQFYF